MCVSVCEMFTKWTLCFSNLINYILNFIFEFFFTRDLSSNVGLFFYKSYLKKIEYRHDIILKKIKHNSNNILEKIDYNSNTIL